jgi:NADH dehydrogenase [ubiquinone] 1 alpha subcomplex assembly factor 3
MRTSLNRLVTPLTSRGLHTTRPVQSLTNIFDTADRPSLTIAKLTPKGFHLSDDLVVPGGLVLAGYQALLWNVDPPVGDGTGGLEAAWKGWTKERFQVFESVVPRPGECHDDCEWLC